VGVAADGPDGHTRVGLFAPPAEARSLRALADDLVAGPVVRGVLQTGRPAARQAARPAAR